VIAETPWDRLWPAMSKLPPSLVAISEHDAIRTALGNCTGKTILDLGCGTGQPVETFSKARCMFAVDSSIEALTRYRGPRSTKVLKVQATAVCLPFPDKAFDIVLAAQLLPHLRPEQRASALEQISRVLKPGGKAILTTLHYNFRFPMLGMAKTGTEEGVYFFRHTVAEFRQELVAVLQVKCIWGVWNYLPKTYQLFLRLGRKTLYWDRIVRRTPLSFRYGKQLLAIAGPQTC
jgi:ubiquinone/menaquinone biosynthesis C-methylase UbiE